MFDKQSMINPQDALPGRSQTMPVAQRHFVNQHSMLGDDEQIAVPEGFDKAVFGLGCFWGAERKFWQVDGVHLTAVGYAAGFTPNPSYEEVCSGRTGHNEVVIVVYDPSVVSYQTLLAVFWESHNPTQGMRQGNDRGTQYRSGIYYYDESQRALAEASRDAYQQALGPHHGSITTEIIAAGEFYFAEDYHQQYLAKNPGGYCGLGGTGVCYPPQS